jgi:hypothetical protein
MGRRRFDESSTLKKDLEGCAPSQPCVRSTAINVRVPPCASETKISSDATAPTERTPASRAASNDCPDAVNEDRWRLGGLRSPRSRSRPKPTSFHGAGGADARQQIGQQWPSPRCQRGSMETWRAAVPRSRCRPKPTSFHGADGADARQQSGQQWPSPCCQR